MDAAVFYLTLDIDDALSGACVNLRQGESGRKIVAALRQSGRPYPIGEGCTAVFAGTRPDGQVFFKHCKLNQGKAVCDISSLITALPGCVKAEIRLYGENDVLIASPAFKIDIMECAMEDGEIAEGPEATALTELISQAQEAIEDCRATAVNKVEVLLTEDQGETSAFVELDKNEDERIMRFTFFNLKGEKGEKGEDGIGGADSALLLATYVTPTATGTIASFDDGADDLPVKSLMVDIDPAQSGSGEPSPTNVRPISGWTGAKVTKAGLESDTTGIYNISFPAEAGTVYGGTLDVTNGVLTVDKAYYQFNGTETPGSMAEFTTVKRATFRLSALGLPDAMAMAGVSNSGKTGLFSHGKYLSAWSGTSADVPHGYADISNLHTYLPFENATSDSVKAYFSSQAQNGTPVQIVYSLATPITYQLTPIEVKTMLGANNIWADTGDVSVSYRADPTIIYNKLTAAIISSGGAV